MRNDETSRSKVKPLLALPVWEQWAKKCYFCLGDKLQFSYDNRLAVYFILNGYLEKFKKKEKSIKSAFFRWIVVLARTNNRKFLESF